MNKVLKIIDNFLNSITMYRLVLYGLLILAGLSILFSFFGLIIYNPLSQIISLTAFIFSCYLSNKILSLIFRAPTNIESFLITALILFFIVTPAENLKEISFIVLISFIAMASKYILTINKKHLFNPAAIAILLISFTKLTGASWWVALPILTIPTLVLGLLIIRKLRRFSLFFAFLVTAVLELILYNQFSNLSLTTTLYLAFTAYPILFLGTIMLTEPLTTPPTRKKQIVYGVIVGLVFSSRIRFDFISSSPELALIIGNIFSYLVSYKKKIILALKEKQKLSSTIYDFVFMPSKKIEFKPGQYLEWTLPHKNADSRGNRRYFTIASSPTEKDIILGARIDDEASSFKKALLELSPSTRISAGSLAGDFVLPNDKTTKLAFLAGGIGITPFRSMVKYLLDNSEERDIVLIHTCSSDSDFVYSDVFEKAQKTIGLKIYCILKDENNIPKDWKGGVGYITKDTLKKTVPDYKSRLFYISGSNDIVNRYRKVLKEIGIENSKIVTDYFPGY